MRPGMQLQHHPGFKADVVPFRLDHGHELLTDIGRDTHPGHPLVGRLRGLAELRGLIAGLSYRHPNL